MALLRIGHSSLDGLIGLAVTRATVVVDHSTIGGTAYGVRATGGSGQATRTILVDSFVLARDTPVSSATAPAAASGASGQPASIVARGSTIIGGRQVKAGVTAQGDAGSFELANTIVNVKSSGPDLLAQGGTIAASSSSFSEVSARAGGSAPPAGSGTNIAVDPRFVDPSEVDYPNFADPVDASGFRLKAGSPLVDHGDRSLVVAGEQDLAAVRRSLDGNGDCVARPDIGAFERPAVVCVSRFRATRRVFAPVRKRANPGRGRARRGTTFLFRLSGRAKVRIAIERIRTGRRVRGRCVKPRREYRHKRPCRRFRRLGTTRTNGRPGRNRERFSGRIKGRAVRPGRYRATIVAIDPLGAKSQRRRLTFRIVGP